ncbi:MAG: right-handed parallel beta-helix repeat-containing protein [Acidobacteriota bacterium]
MKTVRFTLTTLAIMAFTMLLASGAQAQTATRTWVSGVGDDVNPCSRTAPCKSFAGAIAKTVAGGEISVLDPSGFGALTITKSITINGAGTLAGITNSLTNGIVINAGANDTINIRYVSLQGVLNGLNGIRYIAGKNVNLENVSIVGNTGVGIDMNKTSDGNLTVVNSEIRNCTIAGIRAETSAGIARVTMRNTTITNCGVGIHARRNARIVVKESTLASNNVGVHAEGNGQTAVVVLTLSQIANNSGHGVQAGGGVSTNPSAVRIADNVIINNGGSGVSIQANGSVDTFVSNKIIGNNPDGCVGCTNVTTAIN